MWDDTYFESLTPEGKFFDTFILTNPLSTECGIYEISIKKMCYWLGYNSETVSKLIQKFEDDKKIIYNRETSEIAILNRGKYLNRSGKPVIDCLISELQKVKDTSLIELVARNVIREDIRKIYDTFTNRNTNRPSISGEEKEEEEKEEETVDFDKFWELYDKKVAKDRCISKWKRISKSSKEKIFKTLPTYIKATPDKQYRKNPLTYLNQESWNDEYVPTSNQNSIITNDTFIPEQNRMIGGE